MKRIIGSIRDYIDTFEGLKMLTDLNIEYLPENQIDYYVEEIPMETDGIISQDILDNTTRTYQFALVLRFKYEESIKNDIDNSALFDDFQEWIEENDKKRKLPIIEDNRMTPIAIEVLKSPKLIWNVDTSEKATYQIECQLLYEKENR